MTKYIDGFSLGREQMIHNEGLQDKAQEKLEEQALFLLLDESDLDDFLGDHWESLGPLICRSLIALLTGYEFDLTELRDALLEQAMEVVGRETGNG